MDSSTIDAVDNQGRLLLTLLLQNFTLGRFPAHQLMETLCSFLDKNPNVNIPDSAGDTPLHHAVQHDNLPTEAVTKLLGTKEGCNAVQAVNNKHQTPLHLAAIHNCPTATFCALLEVSGNLIHEVDLVGQTALHYACQVHSPEKVSLLLSHGAQSDALMCDKNQHTPLHLATIHHASPQVITLLLEHSSPVWHVKDHQGLTAFDYASEMAVGIMARHDYSVFQKAGITTAVLRQTALHIACDWPPTFALKFRRSRIERIQVFLSLGAHQIIGAVDLNSQTAIHLAVISCIPEDILLSLLDNETSMNAIHIADKLGRTVLHYACMSKPTSSKSRRLTPSPTTLKLLLEASKNADVIHHVDVTGRTALHYACDPTSWSIEKVNILLDHGAREDIGVPDHQMQTPLHLAAMLNGSEVLAKLLASSHISTGFVDLRGRTPLHYMCLVWTPGSRQKISLALKCGADDSVGVPDGPTGRTPIHLAIISGTPAEDIESLIVHNPSAIHVTDDIG